MIKLFSIFILLLFVTVNLSAKEFRVSGKCFANQEINMIRSKGYKVIEIKPLDDKALGYVLITYE